MELTTAGWLLLALASALVGLAKGGLAMVGMLAVPILSLAMSPVQAAGVLLPVYVVSDIFGLIAYRRHWDRRVLATLLPGSIAGIALGWATASLVDDAAVGGMGLACLSLPQADVALADGSLREVLADWSVPIAPNHLYYPSRRQPTAAFQAFVNAMRA